jgi:dephospho-CoA kinase
MLKPILVRLKRELHSKSGMILLNGALLAEADMLKLCNNNVILIKCDKDLQRKRIKGRGLSPSQQRRRIDSQYSFEEKKKKIMKCIKSENHGNMWIIDNSGDEVCQKISKVLKSVEKQWKSF